LNAAAQEKTLSEAEFNSVWKKGCEKTKNVPHIQTEIYESFYDDTKPPYNTYVSLKRYIPLDRVWTIAGLKDGEPEKKYEEIRIGPKSYSRDGSGEWKVKELGFTGLYYCEPEVSGKVENGKGNGSGSSNGRNRIRFEHEFKYMGRRNSADLYVHVKRITFTSPTNESQTTTTLSYWLNSDGLFLKTESTKRTANTQRWERRFRGYKYAQKDLKIEAPIK